MYQKDLSTFFTKTGNDNALSYSNVDILFIL